MDASKPEPSKPQKNIEWETVTRRAFIAPEMHEGMASLFSMTDAQLKGFDDVLGRSLGKNIIELYTDIVNALSISDERTADLVEAYRYILFLTHEREVPVGDVLDEVRAALEKSKAAGAQDAAENIREHSKSFVDFFSKTTGHSIAAKRRYLASRLFNSVLDIHSVCDLRPILNEKRTEIVDWITSTYLEFTVTDSLGSAEIVPLNLDAAALDKLRKELASVETKVRLIQSQKVLGGKKVGAL